MGVTWDMQGVCLPVTVSLGHNLAITLLQMVCSMEEELLVVVQKSWYLLGTFQKDIKRVQLSLSKSQSLKAVSLKLQCGVPQGSVLGSYYSVYSLMTWMTH